MAGWAFGPYQVTPRQDVRIGTAERERAATLLGDHLTAGRLELAEFDERVKAAYAARTGRELDTLFSDLPSAQPPARRGPSRFRLALLVLAGLGVLAVLAAFAAFPPLFIVPVVFLVLRSRHRRFYRHRPPVSPWHTAHRV